MGEDICQKVEEEIRREGDFLYADTLLLLTPSVIYRLCQKYKYKSEREWVRFLAAMRFVGISDLDKVNEKLYSDVWSCLLRVFIRLFGKDPTRNALKENDTDTLWSFASKSMNDGELLHIAVELSSIQGVKATAWPGVIRWKNENGKTALDIAMETEESNKEIVGYLQNLEERLDVSFYQHEIEI